MSEKSTRRAMQSAADGDRSKLDLGGKVGTEDIRAWMLVGRKLLALMIREHLFRVLGVSVLPIDNDLDAFLWLKDIDQGKWEGPMLEVAMIDISDPDVTAKNISWGLRESRRMKNIAIILFSPRPLSAEEAQSIKANANADAVMCLPLPEPLEFERKVLEILLTKP